MERYFDLNNDGAQVVQNRDVEAGMEGDGQAKWEFFHRIIFIYAKGAKSEQFIEESTTFCGQSIRSCKE